MKKLLAHPIAQAGLNVLVFLIVVTLIVSLFAPRVAYMISAASVSLDPQLAAERWQIAQTHVNPPAVRDEFDTLDNPIWTDNRVNGAATITDFSHGHAATAHVANGQLELEVRYDPDFGSEKPDDGDGKPAPSQYNNVYRIGAQDFYPTPLQDVVQEYRMRVSNPFYGSTGVFTECQNTFQPDGQFNMNFWAFGFEYAGTVSSEPSAGLNFTVLIDNNWARIVPIDDRGIDPFVTHVYKTVWYWLNPTEQAVDYFVDGAKQGTVMFPPICVSETQIWADNYWIPWPGFSLLYTNIPQGQKEQSWFDYLDTHTAPASH